METLDGSGRNDFWNKNVTRVAIGFALVFVLAFGAGLAFGADGGVRALTKNFPLIGDPLDGTPDADADLASFWKAWNALEMRFIAASASSTLPSVRERLWGAIGGLTDSYGDPYTVFMPPEDAKVFQEDISGNFEGVGMEIGMNHDGALSVIAPLKDTPAERAGIQAGDLILTINGAPTEGLTTDEAVKLIRGKRGTEVVLNLLRNGAPVTVTVVRESIEMPTIEYSRDPESGVYTISLYSFTANASGLFNRALADFRRSGATDLIIDLRGNPGGYLNSAVALAGHFLPEGAIVVTEDYEGKAENIEHRSRGVGDIPEGTDIVVLVDQGSASASEILAGALQDHDAATLIGMRTFGKGSVQELVDLDGGALKITVARWLTPSGRSISDGGLLPDIEVERTRENVEAGEDPQRERAIQFLTTGA